MPGSLLANADHMNKLHLAVTKPGSLQTTVRLPADSGLEEGRALRFSRLVVGSGGHGVLTH